MSQLQNRYNVGKALGVGKTSMYSIRLNEVFMKHRKQIIHQLKWQLRNINPLQMNKLKKMILFM